MDPRVCDDLCERLRLVRSPKKMELYQLKLYFAAALFTSVVQIITYVGGCFIAILYNCAAAKGRSSPQTNTLIF